MLRCAVVALIGLMLTGPVMAGVDYATTQNGSRFGFGGRDELAVDVNDQMLANTNTFLAGSRGGLLDRIGCPAMSAASDSELGQILNIGGNIRGVLDRLAGKETLCLLFIDGHTDPGYDPRPWLGLAERHDPFGGQPYGSDGGGGGQDGGKQPGHAHPPFDDEPPLLHSTTLTSVPEPTTAACVTITLGLLIRRRPARRMTTLN